MEDKLLEKLGDLNISETDLLLNPNINLSVNSTAKKRIEQSVKTKAGYYNEKNIFSNKINNILGGIFMKRKLALALSLVVVLGLGGGGYAYAKTPVAYVSVDINPSIELGVNAFDDVVSVEAYNEDGQKVLEGTSLINSDVDEAVSTIITNAISDGYIKEDNIITNDIATETTTTAAIEITVSTDKDNVADKLEESLKETADKVLEDNDVEAGVETDNVALARRDEARQLGITPGKLNLIQKLQALDPAIKVEDYKTSSVKDIQKKAKELRKMNKSGETTSDNNANTDTNTSTNTDVNIGTIDTNNNTTNDNTDIDENTQEDRAVIQSSTVDSEKAAIVAPEKNNNSSNDKSNNGSIKKEENSNLNSKKDEKVSTTSEKKNDSSQGNSNSSKLEKSNNGNSNSHSSSKSKNK